MLSTALVPTRYAILGIMTFMGTCLYYEDLERGLKLLSKITHDHIHLNSYSKMTVSSAAQVLSNRVTTILKQYGTNEVKETARYCDLIYQFFDCMNV